MFEPLFKNTPFGHIPEGELALKQINEALGAALSRARQELPDISPSLKLVLAVSGGEDSIVLLHALKNYLNNKNTTTSFKLEVVVAHFNHGLRAESEGELDFVKKLAEKYQIEFFSENAQTNLNLQTLPQGINIEVWAREVRYKFLQEVLTHEKADYIVTAHHLNDQAETMLDRLLSGRLLQRAYGIGYVNQNLKYLRPFLKVSKRTITDYSGYHGLSFVEDPSNYDQRRTRNSIRHFLLPTLEKHYNPSIIPTLAEQVERFGEDEQYLWARAKEFLSQELLKEEKEDRTGLESTQKYSAQQYSTQNSSQNGSVGKMSDEKSEKHTKIIRNILAQPAVLVWRLFYLYFEMLAQKDAWVPSPYSIPRRNILNLIEILKTLPKQDQGKSSEVEICSKDYALQRKSTPTYHRWEKPCKVELSSEIIFEIKPSGFFEIIVKNNKTYTLANQLQ